MYRAHAALLVCTYLGFLGYSAATNPNDPVAALFKARDEAVAQPQPTAMVPSQSSAHSDASLAQLTVADANAVAAPEVAVSDDVTRAEARTRLSQVRLQATNAEEPQRRAEAIDQLTSSTPETLQALQIVVTSDSAVRNRIRAVNSLRALAGREGSQDAVMSILHLAMSDANSSVASRASEVYRELTQAAPVE